MSENKNSFKNLARADWLTVEDLPGEKFDLQPVFSFKPKLCEIFKFTLNTMRSSSQSHAYQPKIVREAINLIDAIKMENNITIDIVFSEQ